jgi:hypothetical protein
MACNAIEWDLLKLLECPGCREYMSSPITICEKGHSVCSSCSSRVWACPTCKGSFTKTRNITVEKIATTLNYPCKNRAAGCELTFTMGDINNHLSECLYTSRECPFRKLSDVDCNWTGTFILVKAHVRSNHWRETSDTGRHFAVKLLSVSTSQQYRKAVFILDELFYLVWKITSSALYFSVVHVGDKESEVFRYNIKIGNSEGYNSIVRVCHKYLEVKSAALEPWNCATFHYGAVEEYLSEEGHLTCEIEIGVETPNVSSVQQVQECIVVDPDVSDLSDSDRDE